MPNNILIFPVGDGTPGPPGPSAPFRIVATEAQLDTAITDFIAGGTGGGGGGGGGALAVTGTAGGAGSAGTDGYDGQLIVEWVE